MKADKTLASFELSDEALENVSGGGYGYAGVTIYECINRECRWKEPRPGYKIGTPMVKCRKCRQMTLDPYHFVKA